MYVDQLQYKIQLQSQVVDSIDNYLQKENVLFGMI